MRNAEGPDVGQGLTCSGCGRVFLEWGPEAKVVSEVGKCFGCLTAIDGPKSGPARETFEDTPFKAAARKAFDHPTQANLQAMAEEAALTAVRSILGTAGADGLAEELAVAIVEAHPDVLLWQGPAHQQTFSSRAGAIEALHQVILNCLLRRQVNGGHGEAARSASGAT